MPLPPRITGRRRRIESRVSPSRDMVDLLSGVKDLEGIMGKLTEYVNAMDGKPMPPGLILEKPRDYGIVATDWKGAVTEYKGQTYRVPLTIFLGAYRERLTRNYDGSEMGIIEVKALPLKLRFTDTFGPTLFEVIGCADDCGNMVIAEGRLLTRVTIKLEKIIRREESGPVSVGPK